MRKTRYNNSNREIGHRDSINSTELSQPLIKSRRSTQFKSRQATFSIANKAIKIDIGGYQKYFKNENYNLKIHNEKEVPPILYLTGDEKYSSDNVLVYKDNKPLVTEELLWEELIENENILGVIKVWYDRQLKEHNIKDYSNVKDYLKNNPFRMIIHTVCKLDDENDEKIDINDENLQKFKLKFDRNKKSYFSKCYAFALIWPPKSFLTDELIDFINVLHKCNYYCRPFSKHSLYISGPEWDDSIFKNTSELIDKLKDSCNANENVNEKPFTLNFTVILHSIQDSILMHSQNDETYEEDNEINNSNSTSSVDNSIAKDDNNNICDKINCFEICKKERVNDFSQMELSLDLDIQRRNSLSIAMYLDTEQVKEDELPDDFMNLINYNDTYDYCDPLFKDSKKFFYAKKPRSDNTHIAQLQANLLDKKNNFHTFALVWIDIVIDNDKDKNIFGYKLPILPSYSIVENLHMRNLTRNNMWTVELMHYDRIDSCYNHRVSRKMFWKDAFKLILQLLFIPIFILVPLKLLWNFLTKCSCNSELKREARYRPKKYDSDGNLIPQKYNYFDLDKTEIIPIDICYIFLGSKIQKYCFRIETHGQIKFKIRFVLFLIILLFYVIMVISAITYIRPFFFRYRRQLLFFHGLGPLLFYALFAITIISWSCHCKQLLSPLEHKLLYHRMIIERPLKEILRAKNRTYWGALINTSSPTSLSLLPYAKKKGYMKLKRPTEELLSLQSLKYTVYIYYILVLAIFLVCVNIEDIASLTSNNSKHSPTKSPAPAPTTSYCESIMSIFLLLLLFMYETMFYRIYSHYQNVTDLSNIIIKNTHYEHISFEYIENILSWIRLRDYVINKGAILFATVETPMLSLGILSIVSTFSFLYSLLYAGEISIFKYQTNLGTSALTTWFMLLVISLILISRLMFYSYKFYVETKKQFNGVKRQSMKINELCLFSKDGMTKNKKNDKLIALKSLDRLLMQLVPEDVMPKIFGIQFDYLLVRGVIAVVFSGISSIVIYFAQKIIGNIH